MRISKTPTVGWLTALAMALKEKAEVFCAWPRFSTGCDSSSQNQVSRIEISEKAAAMKAGTW